MAVENNADEASDATVQVVAVAGVPGSGKTTLLDRMAVLVPDATLLFFDGFEALTEMPADALAAWHAEGADFSRFRVSGLVEALAALKAGRPAYEPVTGRTVHPARLVLFEMPLGRAFAPTRGSIDFLMWIDTPLDVALARNLAAFAAEGAPPSPEWLAGYLQNYLMAARPVLIAQESSVAPDADLVLDGTLSPEALAHRAVAALRQARLI